MGVHHGGLVCLLRGGVSMMVETLNIYQRINEIRKRVDYIQKDKKVSTGAGSYNAVTHDAVTAILREHLIAFGIICIPNLVSSHANDRVGDAKQFRYDATYSFDFVNADKPDEKVIIIIEAHAMDNADKAPGKAISYAKKYAVLKLFEIETGDDEESRYAPEEPTTPYPEYEADILKLRGAGSISALSIAWSKLENKAQFYLENIKNECKMNILNVEAKAKKEEAMQ